ncbi:MAG: AraC family transcriptional regulator [Clostridia bacterium]|nr:AraC family transcriptional regulator [Clostridia bacterium]
MDNRVKFEELIKYIETHLTEKINYNELAKILAVSEQSMQRIFVFITNMSLSEYIRKRRLSKAYEELKSSDIKIMDLAIKYQYESETSFSRSFKNMFNMNPSECRKSNSEFIQLPVYQFNQINTPFKYSYKIEEIEEMQVYAYKTPYTETREDFLYKIRELYQNLKDIGLFEKIVNLGMYGITFRKDNNTEMYYVGCKEKLENSEQITIKAGKYAVFNCSGANQSDIAPLIHNIYTQFVLSTNLDIDLNYCFEYYEKNDNCYLYIHIKN